MFVCSQSQGFLANPADHSSPKLCEIFFFGRKPAGRNGSAYVWAVALSTGVVFIVGK